MALDIHQVQKHNVLQTPTEECISVICLYNFLSWFINRRTLRGVCIAKLEQVESSGVYLLCSNHISYLCAIEAVNTHTSPYTKTLLLAGTQSKIDIHIRHSELLSCLRSYWVYQNWANQWL